MTRVLGKEHCPKAYEHTPEPSGYLAWHVWADGMDRLGYEQRQHDACGLWTQWVTKTGRPAKVSVRRAIEAGR